MLAKTIIGTIALMASSASFAATQTWDFVNGSGSGIENNDAHGIGSGSYIDMTVGGIEVIISAWSSTSSSGTCEPGDAACASDPDPFIRRADLKKYSGGLGAVNGDEADNQPNHAFDNVGGSSLDYDMALLQFSEAVALESIDINWRGDDSDMTVLTYTGGGTLNGAPFSSSDTWTSLLNDGWSHLGNYNDVSTGSNQIVSSATESRYYLVGVYNPDFGSGWSYGNDAIKLAGVTTSTTPPRIPEPATALLFAAGLFGLYRRQR